jgi:hypothetical protein
MYPIDALDEVRELDFPPMEAGSPSPRIWASEELTRLEYMLRTGPTPILSDNLEEAVRQAEAWGARVRDANVSVTFQHSYCHYFGPPSDETIFSHPLRLRGLQSYGIFEVLNSSWVRAFERFNSVHPQHERVRRRYKALKHFVFAFHDSTFECIAMDATFEIIPARRA